MRNAPLAGNTLGMIATALLVTAGLGMSGKPAFGQEAVKIAVVDMQKALQTVEAGRKAKAQLEKEVQGKQKEFQTEKASLEKAGEEFKKQALVMNDNARAEKQGK